MRRKALDSTLFSKAVWVEPPHMCDAYSIHGQIRPLYRVSSWGGVKNRRRRAFHAVSLQSNRYGNY